MNSQDIQGSANQQAGGDIHNYHYANSEEPVISNAQARELRVLVEKIADTNTLENNPLKISVWNELHDYCNTPVPSYNDKRSRYRFIPQNQFYRALSFLQKKLITSLEMASGGITDAKEVYNIDDNPISQKEPDGGFSSICVNSLVSGGKTKAKVFSSGERGSTEPTEILIDLSHDGIDVELYEDDDGRNSIIKFSMFGSAERENISLTFQQISKELTKRTSELGGNYVYSDEGGWNKDFCCITGEVTDLSYK